MADEMQAHLELRTEHWRAQGLSPEEARRRARLEFGAAARYQEECREARGVRLVDEMRADIRYALRQMRRAPLFSAVAITTFALAIGANTAIFSLVEAVLLKSLPVKHPHELLELQWRHRHYGRGFVSWYFHGGDARRFEAKDRVFWSFSFPIFRHLRERTTTFSDVVAFTGIVRMSVTTGSGAELAMGQLVSGNFFHGLGVETILGRTLQPGDDTLVAPTVAVLGHDFWQRAFGGDPSVVGRVVYLNTAPVTVVGVAPRGFQGVWSGRGTDLWLPVVQHRLIDFPPAPPDALENPACWWVRVMARLRPGVDPETARVEAETLVHRYIAEAQVPKEEYDLPRLALDDGGRGTDTARWMFATPLRVMGAATGAILLVACANIAGLLLMRGAARQREIAMRSALGAARWRLVRQLLTESTLLAAIGGGLGVLIAYGLRRVLPQVLRPDGNPLELDMEPRAFLLVFSTLACLLTGFACGLVPALRATRAGVQPVVTRTSVGRVESPRGLWGGTTLVAVQVAVSVVLVVAGTLFVRTMLNLRTQAFGFRPEKRLVFQMDAWLAGYDGERLSDFYQQAIERLTAVPGVRTVSCSEFGIPAQGLGRYTVRALGHNGTIREAAGHVHVIAPRYFEAMGIAFHAGRDIDWADREGAPRVAVVNEAFARRFFGAAPPLGRRFEIVGNESVEVVGLVGNVKFEQVREDPPPTFYLPYRQDRRHSMTFVVRTEGDPRHFVAPLRATLGALDPNVPLYGVNTQEQQIEAAIQQSRLFAHLVSSAAVLALLLACLGTYGTLAYSVARRTSEIGVRAALGATPPQVVRMVLRESLAPVLVGLAIGLLAALAGGHLLHAMLFGVQPTDPATLTAATLLVVASALVAAWLPSYRASCVPPIAALRCE